MKEYLLRLKCHHPECKETSFYSYSTKRDYQEAVKKGRDRNWMCIRHNNDKLLTPTKLSATTRFISAKSEGCGNNLFWNGRGFVYGQGYKAFADDFPEGTMIVETVEIILPPKLKETS